MIRQRSVSPMSPASSPTSRSLHRGGQRFPATTRSGLADSYSRHLCTEALEERALLSVTASLVGAVDWIEQGPAPINKGLTLTGLDNSDPMKPNKPIQGTEAGAVSGIAIDPNDANTVYISTVGGGIWKSINAGNTTPTWTTHTDLMPSLETTCITFGTPTSGGYQTLYAGTGHVSSTYLDKTPGVGIYKTIDGGAHWSVVGTSYFNGLVITSIVALPSNNPAAGNDILIVGVQSTGFFSGFTSQRDGLYRSTDGGTHWTKVSQQSGVGDGLDNDDDGQTDEAGEPAIPSGGVSSVIRDPSSAHGLFAAIAGNFDADGNQNDNDASKGFPWDHKGIYQSIDDGAHWKRISNGITMPEDTDNVDNDQDTKKDNADPHEGMQLVTRILLSASAAVGNPLYAATVVGNTVNGVFRALNPGVGAWTWTSVTGNPFAGNPKANASLHLSLLASNTVADSFYMGFNTIVLDGISGGAIYQVTPSTNTWTSIVGPGANHTSPHADSRFMVFNGSDILEADDGGIYRLQNYNGSASRKWVSAVGTTLAITQISAVAYDTHGNILVTANQDTGNTWKDSPIQTSPGNNTSFTSPADSNGFTIWGDGFSTAVAGDGTRYILGNNLGDFSRRTGTSTKAPKLAKAGGVASSGLVAGGEVGLTGTNTIPIVTNPADTTNKRLLFGYTGLYESADQGDTITVIATPGSTDPITALAYGGFQGATKVPDIFYAARGSDIWVRTAAGAAPTKVATPSGASWITSIALDPVNWKTAYATDGTHLYKTINAGTKWDEVGAKLTATGKKFHAIQIVNGSPTSSAVVVGVDNGVYMAIDPTNAKSWAEVGTNLPNAVVSSLVYVPSQDLLIAGTLGRGAWTLPSFKSSAVVPAVNNTTGTLQITGDASQNNITVGRDFKNPNLVHVSSGSSIILTVPYKSVIKINITSGGGNDDIIIDDAGGALAVPKEVFVDGGTVGGTLSVVSAPSDAPISTGTNAGTIHTRYKKADQIVHYSNFATPNVLVTPKVAELDTVNQFGEALAALADWSPALGASQLASNAISLFNNSTVRALSGQPRTVLHSDPDADLVATAEPQKEQDLTQAKGIIERLLEDQGQFQLSDIGDSITTLNDLVTALDALDDTPGNVTLTTTANGVRLNIEVQQKLEGDADLSLSANTNSVNIDGHAEIGAMVTFRAAIGVDSQGFYIDANGAPGPLVTIDHLQMMDSPEGEGSVGALGVDLKGGSLTIDPMVQMAYSLHEFGADPLYGGTDGLLRGYELDGLPDGLVSVATQGNPNGDDIVFHANMDASPLADDLPAPFSLGSPELTFTYADINSTAAPVVAGATSAAQDLLNFASTTLGQLTSGITTLQNWVNQVETADVFGTQLPLTGKSLGQLLGGSLDPLVIDNSKVLHVGDVFTADNLHKFTVALTDIDLQASNIAAGDAVKFKNTSDADVSGNVASISDGQLIIGFDQTSSDTPNASDLSLRIVRLPVIGHILTSALGDLADAQQLVNSYRTVQDVVRRLAELTGVALEDFGLTSSGTGNNRTIQFSVGFNPDPITLHTSLDFGTALAGMKLSGSTSIDVSIDPQFHLAMGLRLAPGLSPFDRFFIVPDATPEVSLGVSLQLDDPVIAASFGFLDAKLTEDPAVSNNQGLVISGTLKVNIVDPGTAPGTTNQVTISEINNASLANTFQITTDLDFDVDGLLIVADIGTTTLGQIKISLDGDSGPSAPGHVNSLAALQNLPSSVAITGASDFLNFENISIDTVFSAIKLLVDRLKKLGAGGVFDTKIPVINRSLSDLVDLSQDIADKLQNLDSEDPSQFATAKSLQNFFNDKSIPLTVVSSPSDIRFLFNDSFTWSKILPLSFDVGASLGGLVSINSSGQLMIGGTASINTGFGFLTSAGNLSLPDRVFFDASPTNEISITAQANIGYDLNNDGTVEASPFDLTASFGPLQKQVVKARGLIDLSLSADLKDGGNGDGKLTWSELTSNINAGTYSNLATGQFTGSAEARLPLDGSGDGMVADQLGSLDPSDGLILIGGKLTNLNNPALYTDQTKLPQHTGATGSNSATLGIDDPFTQSELDGLGSEFIIETHNLAGFANSVFDVSSLWGGIDTFLNLLEQALRGKVFGVNVPLVGNKLKNGADLIEQIRTKVSGASGTTKDAIQQALFDLLGPGPGLNVLDISANFDGDPALTYHDVPVDFSVPDQALVDLKIKKTAFQSSIPINFDIGLPGLGLSVAPPAAVNVSMNWDVELQLGVSKALGFFFNTAGSHFAVDVTATAPGFNATGQLGFLQLNLVNHPNPAPGENTHLGLHFAVNMQDPVGGDGKVTAGELAAPGFNYLGLVSATASGEAVVNLDAQATFGGNAAFPSLGTNLFINWQLPSFNTANSASDMGSKPTLAFRNTYLDAGSFIGDFLKPYVQTITDALAPIAPIIGFLEQRLPIFSDISALRSLLDADHDGKVTPIELYEAYTGFQGGSFGGGVPDNPAFRFIKQVDTIYKIANKIESFSSHGNLRVPIGSYDLGAADVRSLSSLQNVIPNFTGGSQDFIAGLQSLVGSNSDAAAILDILDDFTAGATASDGGQSSGFSGGDASVAFPIYQHPSSALQLLFGKNIDLVTLTFTPFKFDAGFDKFISLLGPLGILLSGSFNATIRPSFGYDSHGLSEFVNDPSHNPADLLDGLYMVDDDTPGKADEVEIHAQIRAAAALDVAVASVSVGGGILGDVEGDLADPNNDGRVHLDEVDDPACLLNIHGYVDAFLDAEATVDLWLYSHTWTYDIAKTRLFDFTYSCGPSPFDPILADVNGGVMTLHMGPHAAERADATNQFADIDGDEDEAFHVSQKRDASGNIVAGTLTVSWMNFSHDYTGVTSIVADGGGGNDSIIIDPDVNAPATLYGGVGDDTLQAGQVASFLHGGDGDDTLIGGDGNDQLFGEGNNDTLFGGGGDDALSGGVGNDTLQGQAGIDTLHGDDGNDSLIGGDGVDHLFGDNNDDSLEGDAGGDDLHGGSGNDTLDGGDNNDILFGDSGNDVVIGGVGDDSLSGGIGDDKLFGDLGNDTVHGDDGNDLIYGNEGDDQLFGDNGIDTIYGGAGIDTISGGIGGDNLFGDDGNDIIHGDADNDVVQGGAGNDQLFGDDGNDTLSGGLGDDTIHGSAGADKLYGDDGQDQLFGDEGNDQLFGLAGNDTLHGNVGSDTLYGGTGNDQLFGDADNDTLYGDAGIDTIHGNTGDDSIDGGAGNDLLYGDENDDSVHGGDDDDLIEGNDGNDHLYGDAGRDTIYGLTGNDTISGGDDDDLLYGGIGNDTVGGDGGADRIYGEDGNDTLSGGDGDDFIYGGAGNDIIHGNNDNDQLDGGAGSDIVHGDAGSDLLTSTPLTGLGIGLTIGPTYLYGDGDNDQLTVDKLPAGQVSGTIYLDGGDGIDTDTVNISGDGNYLVSVTDTGVETFADTLIVNGTDQADSFLLRASSKLEANGGTAFVAALHGDPASTVERVNYDHNLKVVELNLAGGNDSTALDDNWVPTTINGGLGDDHFQVGQIFKSTRDVDAGVAAQDAFDTVQTTRGYLSNGVSFVTTINGDEDNDNFVVFHNKAPLNLNGNDGNDTFTIRAFAEEGSTDTNIEGGRDFNLIQYVGNAHVNVDGGAGTDILRIIGTEFADRIVLTKDGIFGIGLDVGYLNIEKLEIDLAEGDDEFYVLSTDPAVDVTLFGGLGSDYFSLAGDTPPVVSGMTTRPATVESHTVKLIQGPLHINGAAGNGSTGGLGKPVMLPGETNVLAPDGKVIAYAGTGTSLSTDTMTVNTTDLQGGLAREIPGSTDLADLIGKTFQIANGPGIDRFWLISGIASGPTQTVLTLKSPGIPAEEWGLPDTTSDFRVSHLSPNFFVSETDTLDSLTEFNDGSSIADVGALSDTVLSGLGMGASGVSYTELETVEVLLGTGDDTFTVTGTAAGAITAVHGGGGGDHLLVSGGGGSSSPLLVYGDTTQDRSRYSADRVNAAPGFGFAFASDGDDTVDASADSQSVAIYGGAGNDVIYGSQVGDHLAGGSGDDQIHGRAGADHMYGDSGFNQNLSTRLDRVISQNVQILQIVTTEATGNDEIIGDAGDDIVFGDHGIITQSPGTQRIFTTGNVIGVQTTNVTHGGNDQMQGGADNDVLLGGKGNDVIDGNQGQDLILGDHAILASRAAGIMTSPLFRALAGTQIYDAGGIPQATPTWQTPPGVLPLWANWLITLIDGNFGNDYLAGGANNDMLFGQSGDDLIQGDGSISLSVGAALPSVDNFAGSGMDGDDYIEGGAGNDVILGNLGQDDLIGGSSNLFGLTTAAQRSDGADTIFGGSGTAVARNDLGDLSSTGHARDADMILSDNGSIFRLVGTNGLNSGTYLTFNYDTYSAMRIIPRAAQLLDYTPGGPDFNAAAAAADIGADDKVHGESGDDFIYGMKGADALFGDGQDDNIVGGYGGDWISGGTGDDGILGDDGRIFASRNSTAFGEPLYGIAAILPADINKLVATQSGDISAIANVSGQLKYTANLTPDNLDPNQASPNVLSRPLLANDIIYGGLGNDSIHAGAGDDAVSGAEAPTVSYAVNYNQNGVQVGGPVASDFSHPVNPGNVLGYNPTTTLFALYDPNDTLRELLLTASGGLSKTGSGLEWILNFNHSEGPIDTKWIVGQTTYAGVPTDGDDHIFADLGNDWTVGGTGRDTAYGGWGDDLINVDDVLTTAGGLNNVPETNPSWEDLAYGGAGRDVLISNTGGDRLVDWNGEFNTYRVPWSNYGEPQVSRKLSPALPEFLYALSKSQGADQTLAARYGSDAARNGEPFGELGLVLQGDAAWQAQNGGPRDPQAGNSKAKIDVNTTAGAQQLYETAALSGPTATTAALLSDAQLAGIAAVARARWSALLGSGDSRLAALENIEIMVGNLPPDRLGLTSGSLILIDSDAAGRGWFVDTTPNDNTEFVRQSNGDALLAVAGSESGGRVDLLTVVMHELGHVLGLEHVAGEGADLMNEAFGSGMRLLPTASDLGQHASSPRNGQLVASKVAAVSASEAISSAVTQIITSANVAVNLQQNGFRADSVDRFFEAVRFDDAQTDARPPRSKSAPAVAEVGKLPAKALDKKGLDGMYEKYLEFDENDSSLDDELVGLLVEV